VANNGIGNAAVNRFAVYGADAGQKPVMAALGNDANIDMSLQSKGAGNVQLTTNWGTLQVNVAHQASAVNYLDLKGGATTFRPTITATGTDANVALALAQKGTAIMQWTGQTVGTAIGAAGGAAALPATPLGYITISLNALGNVRIPYYN
jgi:hypothetical protein